MNNGKFLQHILGERIIVNAMRGCNKNKIYTCFSSRQSKIGFDTFFKRLLAIIVGVIVFTNFNLFGTVIDNKLTKR